PTICLVRRLDVDRRLSRGRVLPNSRGVYRFSHSGHQPSVFHPRAASNPEELPMHAIKQSSRWQAWQRHRDCCVCIRRFPVTSPMPLPVALFHDTTSVRRRMKVPKTIPIFAAIGSVIIFGGCADFRQELTARAQRLPDFFSGAATSEGYWRDDHFPGRAKIIVQVAEQRAYFYKGH